MKLEYHIRGFGEEAPVALTFDDGPNPPVTEMVLKVLDRYQVPATFFLIGRWVERWPRTVDRILEAGHEVGNHSYAHEFNVCDYDLAEAAISHITGEPTKYVRAHSFDYHSCALWPMVDQKLVIDADVNPSDYLEQEPDRIVHNVITHPLLGPGSIIDLHDSAELDDNSKRLSRPLPMVESLPQIIESLRSKGLEFGRLADMPWGKPLVWDGDRDSSDPLGPIGPARIGRRSEPSELSA